MHFWCNLATMSVFISVKLFCCKGTWEVVLREVISLEFVFCKLCYNCLPKLTISKQVMPKYYPYIVVLMDYRYNDPKIVAITMRLRDLLCCELCQTLQTVFIKWGTSAMKWTWPCFLHMIGVTYQTSQISQSCEVWKAFYLGMLQAFIIYMHACRKSN